MAYLKLRRDRVFKRLGRFYVLEGGRSSNQEVRGERTGQGRSPFRLIPPRSDLTEPRPDAVREIEDAVDLVRRAGAHIGLLPPREKWAEAHARACRQLRKLLQMLRLLRRSVRACAAAEPSHEEISKSLQRLERELEPLLSEPLRKGGLNRLRKVARGVHRDLVAKS